MNVGVVLIGGWIDVVRTMPSTRADDQIALERRYIVVSIPRSRTKNEQR